jgi:uncharacterized membrane protein
VGGEKVHSAQVFIIAQTYRTRNEKVSSEVVFHVSDRNNSSKEESMLGTVLIVLLVLFLVGALPTWNHSRSWGYFPSGGLGFLLVVVVVLLLLGRI